MNTVTAEVRFNLPDGFIPATDPTTLIGLSVGDRIRVHTRMVAFWEGDFEGTVATVATDEFGVYVTTAEPVEDAPHTSPYGYDVRGRSPHGYANSNVDRIERLDPAL